MSKFLNLIKENKDDIIKPIVVLLAICIVIPLALSLTNLLTADRIAKLQKENEEQTMEGLIKADDFKKEKLNLVDGAKPFDYYIALKDEKESGYIFTTTAKGYGGDVSVMTAIDNDGKVIAVSILDAANETPGLGQNVTKEKFYSQYKDKTSGVSVVKNSAEGNQINAVTGATISSKAVTNAVNKALDYYEIVSKEKGEVKANEKQ